MSYQILQGSCIQTLNKLSTSFFAEIQILVVFVYSFVDNTKLIKKYRISRV